MLLLGTWTRLGIGWTGRGHFRRCSPRTISRRGSLSHAKMHTPWAALDRARVCDGLKFPYRCGFLVAWQGSVHTRCTLSQSNTTSSRPRQSTRPRYRDDGSKSTAASGLILCRFIVCFQPHWSSLRVLPSDGRLDQAASRPGCREFERSCQSPLRRGGEERFLSCPVA